MKGFIANWVISAVMTFVTRQILKWGDDIDWDIVKKDFDERVRSLMPGEFMDDTAAALASSLIDAIKMTIGKDGGLDMIRALVEDGEWDEIYMYLKNLIIHYWRPVGSVQMLTLDRVHDYLPVRLHS